MNNIDTAAILLQPVVDIMSGFAADIDDMKSAIAGVLDNKDGSLADLESQVADLINQVKGANGTIITMQGTIDDLRAKLAAATAVVNPAPTPTPVPSSLTPALVQHYSGPDADGFFNSSDGWQTDIANLGFAVAGVDYARELVLEFDRQQNYDATGKNLKIIRGWKTQSMPGTASACNVYAGKTKEDWKIVYVEGSDMVASQETTNWTLSGGKMRRERWELVFNSAPGVKDGVLRRFIDGLLEFEKKGMAFDSATHPGLPTFWCLQDDYSPNTGDTGPFKPTDSVKIRPVTVAVK